MSMRRSAFQAAKRERTHKLIGKPDGFVTPESTKEDSERQKRDQQPYTQRKGRSTSLPQRS